MKTHIGRWSSMPSTFEEAAKAKTLMQLAGNQSISTSYQFILYSGIKRVEKIDDEGEVYAAICD
ncbi:MAG: hypothetical protein RR504_01775 [Christensenellaceae bacterium]